MQGGRADGASAGHALRDLVRHVARALILGATIASATNARAADDEGTRLEWRDEWARFRPAEYVATAAMATTVAITFATVRPAPTWHGGVLWDDAVRSALRANTEAGMNRANAFSDAIYYSLVATPFVVDAVGAAWIGHGNGDVAWQLAMIDLEALAVNGMLFRLTEISVRRARPYVSTCLDEGGSIDQCFTKGHTSFPSGHTSTVVTAATLVCTEHARLELFGGGAPDALTCAAAIALAATTATLRMVSDNHWSTDVLAGAAIGVFSGYVVPVALHWGFGGPSRSSPRAEKKSVRVLPMPMATQNTLGAALAGVF